MKKFAIGLLALTALLGGMEGGIVLGQGPNPGLLLQMAERVQDSSWARDSLASGTQPSLNDLQGGFSQQRGWQIQEVAVTCLLPRRRQRQLRRRLRRVDDSAELVQREAALEHQLRRWGYAEARLEGLRKRGDTLSGTCHTGSFYYYDSLSLQGVSPSTLDAINYEQLNRAPLPFSWQDLNQRLEAILTQYENAGYPFASFTQPHIHYRRRPASDSIAVRVRSRLEHGRQFTIDSIRIKGDIREHPNFVEALIGLRPGSVYNQQEIEEIPRVLNNTIYYKEAKPPQILFKEDKATLILEMQRRQANRFDALVGLLPPQGQGQQFQFTGMLDLQLVSPFKTGEILRVKYEKLTGSSQRLNAGYTQPFLFGSSFEVQATFDLLKQDTSFLTRTFRPSLGYRISENLSARVYFKSRNTNLLDPDPYETVSWPPPPILDSQSRSIGLGFTWDTRDYRHNPGSGVYVRTNASLGQRRISRTRGLDSLDYGRLALEAPRRELNLDARVFIPTFGTQLVLLRNQTFWLDLEQYFDNDQEFIGGAQSLRGFNENRFLTNLYSIVTAEYRLRLGRNAYLGAFVDWGYLEYKRLRSTLIQKPLSTGLTFAFETPAGILRLSYGIGRVGDQPFQPTRGRVHIGLVNAF